MKIKIMAIGVIMLFLGLGISSVNAIEFTKDREDSVIINYLTLEDGVLVPKTETLNLKVFERLRCAIDELIEKLKNCNDWDIFERIEKMKWWRDLKTDHPVVYNILKGCMELRCKINKILRRPIVISHGYSKTLDLTREDGLNEMLEVTLKKKCVLWHYNSNGLIKDKTLVLNPFNNNKAKLYTGKQIGAMIGFRGLYLEAKLPGVIKKSDGLGFIDNTYVFFMGTATRVIGFDMPNIFS